MAQKVLVVDDSAAIRQSITFVLEQEGFEVVAAGDGEEGLAALKTQGVDLIVTDVNMPNMDGITFTRELRKLDSCKYIPVIVLTTESQNTKMQEGKEAGATGWIVKPFSAEKLLSVVKKVMG
ncbi:MAG: response regulator [Spirochaetales bacterium]|nr:response regulator [Spirochaetales bacterium]MCF7938010.1 response regulator [Spirochaetales bacterium]